MLRRERKSGKVAPRPTRGSGTNRAVPRREEEEDPTTPSRKRPRRRGTEDVLHAEPELSQEPAYKVCPLSSASRCPGFHSV